jgi:hypothetical protein
MALVDISGGNGFNLKENLKVGDQLAGFVLGFTDGKHGQNISFRREDTGEEITVFGQGNLKYDIRDGRIKVGLYTVITRLDDEKVKGMTSTKYKTQQDPERSVATELLEQIATPPVQAAPATGVRARAQEIAKQVATANKR